MDKSSHLSGTVVRKRTIQDYCGRATKFAGLIRIGAKCQLARTVKKDCKIVKVVVKKIQD